MKVLKTTAAGLLVLLVVVAPPYLLIRFIGNPYPPEGLDLAARLSDNAIMGLIAVLVWILWAQFVLSLLVEGYAAFTDRAVDVRMPVFGVQQDLARALIAAILTTAVVAPISIGSAGPAAAADSTPTATISTSGSSASQWRGSVHEARHQSAAADLAGHDRSNVTAATPAHRQKEKATEQSTETITVTAQRGDTLWSLAETYLGDGDRWSEIAAANSGQTMTDGAVFTSANQIRAGWHIAIPGVPAAAHADHVGGTEQHRVEAGDTLSGIAEEQLGDATRFPEIFAASRGITQPNGQHLTDPDVIDVGWTVTVPPARSGTRSEPPADAPQASQPRAGGDAVPDRGTDQPDQVQPDQVQPDQVQPDQGDAGGQARDVPPASEATPGAQASDGDSAPAQASPATDVDDEDTNWPVRTAGGVGMLLAGMLVALLGRRRAQQRRRRKPGERIPLPAEGSTTQQVEIEVRVVADETGVEFVDVALRSLAAHAAATGQPIPHLQAARMTDRQLDLYLLEAPAEPLPAPWQATSDPTVWVLQAADQHDLTAPVDDVPPLWPALVSLGHDTEQGVVLLNLAQARSLRVTGDQHLTSQVLTALAIELGTAPWAEHGQLNLTTIGSLVELADALPTGRLRYVPTVRNVKNTSSTPHVVVAMWPLSPRDEEQLRDQGVAVVTQGPTQAAQEAQQWTLDLVDGEHAVLQPIGLEITPQRVDSTTYASILEMLDTSLSDPARPGDQDAAHVVPFDRGRPPGSRPPKPSEHFPFDEVPTQRMGNTDPRPSSPQDPAGGDRGHLNAVPPPSRPGHTGSTATTTQTLDDRSTTQVLLRTSTASLAPGQTPDSGPESAACDGAHAQPTTARVPLEDTGPPIPVQFEHPTIRLLAGTVDIVGASSATPNSETHLKVCTRIAAYLALNPETSRAALVESVWGDRRVSADTVNSRLSQLRTWFGDDPNGERYLPRRGLRFADTVTTDWARFTELVGDTPDQATTQALEQACAMIRGRPLEGEESKHYGFAEYLLQEIIDTLADTTYELARRRYMAGEWHRAGHAAARGIRVDPANERLWRLRIHSAHSAGDPTGVAEAIDRMHARITKFGFELDDATTQLLAAITNHDTAALTAASEQI